MTELRWMPSALDAATRAESLGLLSPAELSRHDATPLAHRDTFLAGRLLLRGLVAELTGVTVASVTITANCPDCGGPHGRPESPRSGLRLSLAHGAGAVVAAASDRSVGIDVEAVEQSPERLAAIGSVAGEPDIRHWTRVEAILKADGRGLRVDPREVRIGNIEGETVGFVADRPARYRISEVELADGVRVSVAEARQDDSRNARAAAAPAA